MAKKVKAKVGRILFTREQIQERLGSLAAEIQKRYASQELSVVAVLKGSLIFTADLVSSTTVTWNGKSFNLRDVVPQGMTCFEFGKQGSSWEVGSCVAR